MDNREAKQFYAMHRASPLGPLMLASDGDHITGLWLEGQKYFGATLAASQALTPNPSLPVFAEAGRWLDAYFTGGRPRPGDLPLAPQGGAFRQMVWEILREIPYGAVITYGQIAAEIARRTGQAGMSAQAVGGAVGHNPIAIIIPCHRVVGASGSLTGFAAGIGKKIRLLEHEGVDVSAFRVPSKGTAL